MSRSDVWPWARRLTAAGSGVLLVAAPWLVDGYTLTLVSRALAVGLLAVSVAVLAGRVGLVIAALTGLVMVYARGVTFLLISLLVGVVTAIAAGQWTSVTGGTDGLADIPPARPVWAAPPLTSDRAVYGYVLIVAAVLVALTLVVLRSPAGLLLAGCRDNETRMRASGHPVSRYLYAAIVGVGAIAGTAGSLTVTAVGYIAPADVGFDAAVLVLLAAAIGGTVSVVGALLGTAMIVGTRDWLAGPWQGHAPLLLGVLFITAVYARSARSRLEGIRPDQRGAS